jgi:hypothetical protein
LRYKRPWLKRKKPRDKTRGELIEIEKSECRHHIISRLLKEYHIAEAKMNVELEKFPEVGHKTIWRMYYLEMLIRSDFSNSYDRREYHWILRIDNPLLTEPNSEYYFADTAKVIEAQRECNKIYFSQLNGKNAENNKDTPAP